MISLTCPTAASLFCNLLAPLLETPDPSPGANCTESEISFIPSARQPYHYPPARVKPPKKGPPINSGLSRKVDKHKHPTFFSLHLFVLCQRHALPLVNYLVSSKNSVHVPSSLCSGRDRSSTKIGRMCPRRIPAHA
ncbi:hypothetical protein BDN70DRAFT_685304 [Pholiota conissans]|uniref:Uncharacterized protein n=1 Tax=Pholiota conissans TaxID=109636 RepID=A0A9P5Z3F4_9AGAR|nr:hypothetical protein BDN70DRAFT_685304 [Pholiota conissans]